MKVKSAHFTDGVAYEEEHKVKTYGKAIQLYAHGRQKIFEVSCKHFVALMASTIAGRVIEVEAVLKGTNKKLSHFRTAESDTQDFSRRPWEINGVVEVFITPVDYQGRINNVAQVAIHYTGFANGLDEAKSLARNRASSSRIWDQDLFSDQGPHAHDRPHGPYQSPDSDE